MHWRLSIAYSIQSVGLICSGGLVIKMLSKSMYLNGFLTIVIDERILKKIREKEEAEEETDRSSLRSDTIGF